MEPSSANGGHSGAMTVIKKEEEEYEEQLYDVQVSSLIVTKQEKKEELEQTDTPAYSQTRVLNTQPQEGAPCNPGDESEEKKLMQRMRKRGVEERERAAVTPVSSGSSLWHCRLCQRSFSSSWELNGHCCTALMVGGGTNDATKLEFRCPVCGDRFLRPTAFIMHKQSHVGQSQYVCGVCGRVVNTLRKLSSHRRSHARGLAPCHRSPACPCSFLSLEALKSHRRGEHCGEADGEEEGKATEEGGGDARPPAGNTRGVFAQSPQCLRCFMTFRDAETAERHLRFKHPVDYEQKLRGNTVFACCVCDRTFPSSRLLSAHQRTHSKWSLPPSGVEKSLQEMRQENGANSNRGAESEGKQFVTNIAEMSTSGGSSKSCLHCHIIFGDPRTCQRHMMSKHSTSTPPTSPGTSSSRHLPLRPPRGQRRPYSCAVCGEKFIQESSLAKHYTEAHGS